MKTIIIILILLLPTLSLAIPTGSVEVGVFSAGTRCYQFIINSYTIDLIYVGGKVGSGMWFRLLSSPENPIYPTGYIFLVRDTTSTGTPKTYIEWGLGDVMLGFTSPIDNNVRVYIVP